MTGSPARRVDLVGRRHGVGARGENLAPLGRAWARRFDGVHFTAPDAPFTFDDDPALRQWYSLTGVMPENRAGRVTAAAAAFDAVIDAEIARARTTTERTMLVGFSQGGSMALDAVVRGRGFAGLLALSTRLATAPSRRLDGLPLRVVHGDADGAVPFHEGERIRDAFAAVGARVDLVRIPRGDHGIGPATARAGLAFLREIVEGTVVG